MYELGDYSKEEHQQIGKLLQECKFQLAILVGEDMKYAHEVIPNSRYFTTKAEVVKFLDENPVSDATILLKASRGIGLETLVSQF
jgi:UDP-N-acetylmuramoyl-tripeptide--D-alanyl-D-alanine ligase